MVVVVLSDSGMRVLFLELVDGIMSGLLMASLGRVPMVGMGGLVPV